MSVVEEYRKRRRKRLDEKAVWDYRERRDQRWIARMDAEEDENNSGGSGSHGNTKIPFGLCQREGIKVDPKWTPKDAWDALAGKGYSAGEVYKELKETGKVKSRKAKKPPTKITESHFPEGMVKRGYKKNTMEWADYISSHCDDGDVTEFLSSAVGPGADDITTLCKKSTDGTARVHSRWYTSSKKYVDMTVQVPSFSSIKDEAEKAAAMRSFTHEWTHYIDMRAKGVAPSGLSADNEELKKAIDNNDGMKYGDEVKKLFQDFNEGYEKFIEEYKGDIKNAGKMAADKLYGDNYPDWLTKDGKARSELTWKHYDDYDKWHKEKKKMENEISLKNAAKRRAYMDGVSCLQGMYDALSGGRLRNETKEVKYGHDLKYYASDPSNKPMELLADYVALKSTSSPLVEVFRRDKPEIAAALDGAMVDIVKKMRGAGS